MTILNFGGKWKHFYDSLYRFRPFILESKLVKKGF